MTAAAMPDPNWLDAPAKHGFGWTLERRQALGAAIEALLVTYSPFGVALYLSNTFNDLDGQTPLCVLQHGDVDRVLGVVEAMKAADW